MGFSLADMFYGLDVVYDALGLTCQLKGFSLDFVIPCLLQRFEKKVVNFVLCLPNPSPIWCHHAMSQLDPLTLYPPH